MTIIQGNPLEGRDPEKIAWTKTFTGKTFYYCHVTPDIFDVVDIAHSLARLCRWVGHVGCEHYSVAEHSIIMSDYALSNTEEDRYGVALAALFHDAAETYTADIPKPYKMLFPELKVYETFLTKAIFESFGLPWKYYAVVKELDRRIMANESELVSGAAQDFKHLVALENSHLHCFRSVEAEITFLETHTALASRWVQERIELDVAQDSG